MDGDVKIAPYPVKFSPDIGVGVPAFEVVFGHFRIPLGHGISHSFGVVSPGATDLDGNLCIPLHFEGGFCPRSNGGMKSHLQYRACHIKFYFLPVLGQLEGFYVPDLVRGQFGNSIAYPWIGIGY